MDKLEELILSKNEKEIRTYLCNAITFKRDFSDGELDNKINQVIDAEINLFVEQNENYIINAEPPFDENSFKDASFYLKQNFSKENLEKIKVICNALYGPKEEPHVEKEPVKVETEKPIINYADTQVKKEYTPRKQRRKKSSFRKFLEKTLPFLFK